MTPRIWIFESEVRAIAEETMRWDTETGGDLFGDWGGEPIVLLATRLGPASERGLTECRFDLSHLEQIGTTLAVDWSLGYFGDWHSHGRSDVTFPSRTDRNRIGHLIQRNRFERLVEFIATKPLSPRTDGDFAIHGYEFPATTWHSPGAVEIVMVPGVGPVREILAAREEFASAQNWFAWTCAIVRRFPSSLRPGRRRQDGCLSSPHRTKTSITLDQRLATWCSLAELTP